MNRLKQVRDNVKIFRKWTREGQARKAMLLAAWLYDQHVEHKDIHDKELLKILKELAMEYRAGFHNGLEWTFP